MGIDQARRDRRKRRQQVVMKPEDSNLMSMIGVVMMLFLLAQLGIYAILTKRTDTNLSFIKAEQEELKAIVRKVVDIIPPKWRLRHSTTDQSKHDIEMVQRTFPVHVGDDMEEIDHPAILLANQTEMDTILRKHRKLKRKIRVPRFWNPTNAYGASGVRAFLGDNGERLITAEEAGQIGSSTHEGMQTIYVSLATFRDPECGPTLEDLFERATFPERIRVSIVDQRTEDDPICDQPARPCEEDPEQTLCKYRHLIESFEQPAEFSVGPVFARHLAHRMYRGEYFAMQVDSHVRFVEGWDADVIQQWESAKNEMAVLTVYLSSLDGRIDPDTHQSLSHTRPIMCDTIYEDEGVYSHLRHDQQPEGRPNIVGEPTYEPFWAAGFSFARGHFLVQVPYDQHIPMVFQGEEISMGVRGFTYGYDYYAPERSMVFHMYNRPRGHEVKGKFWENEELFPNAEVEGMKRLNAIIGTGQPGASYYSKEEHKYGVGKVRPLAKFYDTFGIHRKTRTVEDHLCRFIHKKLHDQIVPALRKNRMGIDFDKVDYVFEDPDPEHDDRVSETNVIEVTKDPDEVEEMEDPESWVDTKIKVKCSNGYFYKAKVTDYDETTKRHHIAYADGEHIDIDLAQLVFREIKEAHNEAE